MDASPVAGHYGWGDLASRVRAALAAAGLDDGPLSPADLAPLDEFHVRGRQATVELAELTGLSGGERVLDVGSGLGGPARHLAAEFEVEVVGIDLTPEFCDVAAQLTRRAELDDRVTFHCANALDLHFADGEFDVVWTQHAAMNIADKRGLYTELRRVAREGGRLALYDVTAGDGGGVHFPVPWARSGEISFLVSPAELRELLEASRFEILEWGDVTAPALEWFHERIAAAQPGSAPPLGLHVLLGDETATMFSNLIRNLEEQRIRMIQAVAAAAS